MPWLPSGRHPLCCHPYYGMHPATQEHHGNRPDRADTRFFLSPPLCSPLRLCIQALEQRQGPLKLFRIYIGLGQHMTNIITFWTKRLSLQGRFNRSCGIALKLADSHVQPDIRVRASLLCQLFPERECQLVITLRLRALRSALGGNGVFRLQLHGFPVGCIRCPIIPQRLVGLP